MQDGVDDVLYHGSRCGSSDAAVNNCVTAQQGQDPKMRCVRAKGISHIQKCWKARDRASRARCWSLHRQRLPVHLT